MSENNVHMFLHLEQKRGVLPIPSKVRIILSHGGRNAEIASSRATLVNPAISGTTGTFESSACVSPRVLPAGKFIVAHQGGAPIAACGHTQRPTQGHWLAYGIDFMPLHSTSKLHPRPYRSQMLSGRHPPFYLGSGTKVHQRGGDWSNSKGSGNADGVQASRNGLLHTPRQGLHSRSSSTQLPLLLPPSGAGTGQTIMRGPRYVSFGGLNFGVSWISDCVLSRQPRQWKQGINEILCEI